MHRVPRLTSFSFRFIATLLASTPFVASLLVASTSTADEWRNVPLQSRVDRVQPWTGIVLWADHDKNDTPAIQLEYSYVGYNEVVNDEGAYDWSRVESLLDEVASRSHQAILRFYFVYPGKKTSVPGSIKKLADYQEVSDKSEGKPTEFVDWSHPAIQQFALDFYTKFAQRYDQDPRLAYLQTGFGLWAEYHIYDGPSKLGETFPSKRFQEKFLKHMNTLFQRTPWMISADAADNEYSPIEGNDEMLALNFGIFDDSFLCKKHAKYNADNWRVMGSDRWHRGAGGGEFSYYNKKDQKLALSADGPNGRSFEADAAKFHISWMLGNDQLKYQSIDRIREAGMASGYRLRIDSLKSNGKTTVAQISNIGVAPMYHDAYLAVGNVRSSQSLRGLLPGKSKQFTVDRGSSDLKPTIQSDRLLGHQQIQYDADLK